MVKSCRISASLFEIMFIILPFNGLTADQTANGFTTDDPARIGDLPVQGRYVVPNTIGPEDGRHLFTYIGQFLIYITPGDLSIGRALPDQLSK